MNPLTEMTGSNEEGLQNSPHSRGIILRSAPASLSLLRREAPRSYVEDLFLVLQKHVSPHRLCHRDPPQLFHPTRGLDAIRDSRIASLDGFRDTP